MQKHDVIQYSPEWWALRMGRPTASNFDKIITPGGKPSAQADKYIDTLIAEIICPTANFFTERPGHTAAMRNGINTEPQARKYFELETDQVASTVGFVTTDDGRFGCSPDFMTLQDEPGELKCPELSTHVGYLRKGILPADYRPQVHGQLIVTGKERGWFMSYCNGCPTQLLVQVVRDEYTKQLEIALELFWTNFQEALEKVRAV